MGFSPGRSCPVTGVTGAGPEKALPVPVSTVIDVGR